MKRPPKPAILPENRLPIEHPNYRYAQSRNIYWQRLQEMKGEAFTDHETEQFKSQWRNQFADSASFPTDRKLHVEIGCNMGHVINAWALQNPNDAFIGIDWKFKVIHRCVEKARSKEIKNSIYLRAHAERLQYIFGEGEIDFLYLYFPDPWPRKSQWKKRFITAEKLRPLAKLLSPNGVFHIKTDHEGYFDWMLEAFDECQNDWDVIEKNRDLHSGNPNARNLVFPEVTLFEQLFIKDGIPIKSLKAKRTR